MATPNYLTSNIFSQRFFFAFAKVNYWLSFKRMALASLDFKPAQIGSHIVVN